MRLLSLASPLALACLLFGACRTDSGAAPETGRELWQGAHSHVRQADTRLVRQPEEWFRLWNDIGREAPRPLGENEIAAALFLGERRTGGYAIEILGVDLDDGHRVVRYREKAPPPDAIATQVLTHPWAVIVLSRDGPPVIARQESRPAGSPRRPRH